MMIQKKDFYISCDSYDFSHYVKEKFTQLENSDVDVTVYDSFIAKGKEFASELDKVNLKTNIFIYESEILDVINNGMADTKSKDLETILRYACMEYFSKVAQYNVESILHNYLVSYIYNNQSRYENIPNIKLAIRQTIVAFRQDWNYTDVINKFNNLCRTMKENLL